jgi:prepilin-type N-terminal cleavage/methylation domain-containing protein
MAAARPLAPHAFARRRFSMQLALGLLPAHPAGDIMHIRSVKGFTLVELLIVVGVIGTVAAIAAPGLMRARMAGNEASAIGSLRAVNSAQSTYSSTCAANGYAVALDDLAKPPIGAVQGFISPDLSANGITKTGYVMNLAADSGAAVVTAKANTCNAAANDAMSAYFGEAHPATVGATGQRSFAVDTLGTIYFRLDGATIAPGMAGAAVLQ